MLTKTVSNIDFRIPTNLPGLCFATIRNNSNYEDSCFIYVEKGHRIEFESVKLTNKWNKLVEKLVPYTTEVSKTEEAYSILDRCSEQCIKNYLTTLNEQKLNNYDLYEVYLNKGNKKAIDDFMTVFAEETSKNNEGNLQVDKLKDFFSPLNSKIALPELKFNIHPENNDNEYTLYVILRTDLGRTLGEQMADIAEATFSLMSNNTTYFLNHSEDWGGQVVILQADYEDLFIDNFIPSKYSDSKFISDFVVNWDKKVAHGNFQLQEPSIVALTFFGIKKELPKFIKKLQLWRK